ncbi:MAG: GtrA family protein [Alloprevotella sp.]|nr:GtrA family protein [Alloprevotella sp.]MBR1652988.1 GtrA family protein [Alloprevotella sp.]
MTTRTRHEAWLLVKYGMVGVVNTAVTAAAFFLLRWLGVGEDLANLLSYVAGVANSFVMNKLFVFRDRQSGWVRQGATFFLGAGVCWLLQWGAFRALLTVLPEAWAYFAAMLVYNVLYYIYNRLVTFKQP